MKTILTFILSLVFAIGSFFLAKAYPNSSWLIGWLSGIIALTITTTTLKSK